MRMLLKAQLDVSKANEALKDGSLQKAFESIMEKLNPEAAYFTVEDGKRTALIVFDLADPSQMPVAAEPLFQAVDAAVDFTPVMTEDDLQKGLQQALG